ARPPPCPPARRRGRERGGFLLQVVLELLAAARVAQLAQRLRLDLANPLAGDAEALSHFFPRPLVALQQSEPKLQHPPLARQKGIENEIHLGAQHRQASRRSR